MDKEQQERSYAMFEKYFCYIVCYLYMQLCYNLYDMMCYVLVKKNSYFRYIFPSNVHYFFCYNFWNHPEGGGRVDARYTHAQGTSPPGTHLLKVDILPTLQPKHIFCNQCLLHHRLEHSFSKGSFNFGSQQGEQPRV